MKPSFYVQRLPVLQPGETGSSWLQKQVDTWLIPRRASVVPAQRHSTSVKRRIVCWDTFFPKYTLFVLYSVFEEWDILL
jgi:hypothetical protein